VCPQADIAKNREGPDLNIIVRRFSCPHPLFWVPFLCQLGQFWQLGHDLSVRAERGSLSIQRYLAPWGFFGNCWAP